MITKCCKRDGSVVPFRIEKIAWAIFRAAQAVGGTDYDRAEKLAHEVVEALEARAESDTMPVEVIQNQVEKTLIENSHSRTAKAYILYREKRRNVREGNALIDATIKMFSDYLDDQDWRIQENANSQKSIGGLNNYVREAFTKRYWLNEVYPEAVREAHTNGDFHLHDLGFFGAYCAGWDLRSILIDGFGGAPGKVESNPPKHLRAFLGQIVNSTYTTAGETAGAQAWSSIDTYCAPFIREDNLSYDEVKQSVQEFIFNLNVPTRVGYQSPFSNLTFDLKPPAALRDQGAIVGGKVLRTNYGDYQKEMDMFNRAFCEVMLEGDAKGRVFTFPIPTINITSDLDWDSEIVTKFMEIACRYGIPYFSNYINSDLSPEDALSMCPLTGDTEVIFRNAAGFVGIMSIHQIFHVYDMVEVWTTDGWRKARPVKMQNTPVLEICTANGAVVEMGVNHIQPVEDGRLLRASELRVGMKLPFNTTDAEVIDGCKSGSPDRDFTYSVITLITKINYAGNLYCFEVESDDHLFMLANGLMTHNCRLRLNTSELRKRGGGLFGSNPMTGSIGVVTINLPRIGYLSHSEAEFHARVRRLAEIARDSLELKRKIVEQQTQRGLYPYCQHYLRDVKARTGSYWYNHFNTIGLVGMNEAIRNFYGDGTDLTSEKGQQFAVRVMEKLRELMVQFQGETGNFYNLEATPAEGTSYRLAAIDKRTYPDILTAGTDDVPYYTNSSQLPVGFTDDIFRTMDLQDELQSLYTGGTVLHLYLGERVPDPESAKKLIRTVFTKYKMPYISLTPTFSICPEHGYLVGEHFTCPTCGKDCEVWSRVVGYLRPVQNYNKGKKQEYRERVKYVLRDEQTDQQAALLEGEV